MPMPPKKPEDKPKSTTFKGAGGSTSAMKGAGGTTTMGRAAIGRAATSGAAPKTSGGHTRGWFSGAAASPKPVSGTVRSGGAGYTGEKGNAPTPAAKSAKMSATLKPKPKGTGLSDADRAYKRKGPADYNRDVGAFYLNATSGMFSKDAGGKKKK